VVKAGEAAGRLAEDVKNFTNIELLVVVRKALNR
jgi:hypothetical protein